ncbi:hypothetical protein B0I35DRAFT_415630 [Stachybotrys elegans]|uniref:Tse2 ADP-ribosyltransferase toxin domain-containing protein n=1 Tax=Stachybotrys elegans TaxID=80388 RepID=A0A8K0T5F3_9HYPO|nr:hypothetical protein B0I35DRAFT_415630 [Stachybotrys elegans]
MANLIAVFRQTPKELFRVNNGWQVSLRAWSPSRRVYDIVPENGLVKPKALDLASYKAPNGASMRPNSLYQQSLVSWRHRGNDVMVYAVPKGTDLPEDLLLVHERSDHYSLQPAIPMTLEALNTTITRFLLDNAQIFTREQWLHAYPKATDNL